MEGWRGPPRAAERQAGPLVRQAEQPRSAEPWMVVSVNSGGSGTRRMQDLTRLIVRRPQAPSIPGDSTSASALTVCRIRHSLA